MTSDKANFEIMNHKARRERNEVSNPTAQLDRIYERDRGICQICFLPCKRTEASREHLKDFALCTKEEARSDDNMVLAHIVCNGRRHSPNAYQNRNPEQHLSYTIAEAFPDFVWNLKDLTSEAK